jgi:RNA polymerase sigma-70 factor, ECF subfamily
VTRSTDDDQVRFQELYRMTRVDLLAYLVRRARSPEDAADMLAETYLIAWRKFDQLPHDEGARLWLFGVARRLLLEHARRRRVTAALNERLANEIRAARPRSPIDVTEHATLAAALAQLTPRDREVLTLTAWEGLTPREISKVLGISANAVRIRLHRCRTRLLPSLASARPPQPRSTPATANADR